MNGNEYRGDSPNGFRPRHTAHVAPRRIGWRTANRIVSGKDGGPGAEDLHTLIAVASAPASAERAYAEADFAGREAVLTAFRESAAAWEPGAGRRRTGSRKAVRRSARSRRASRALVLRFTTAVFLVCGVGVAAASAGVLPAGVQRIAHHYFGIGRASEPSTHVRPSNAVTPSAPNGSGGHSGSSAVMAPGASGTTSAASAVIVALCQQVAQDKGNNWEKDLDAADQATLIAAANGEHQVKSYCARTLAGVGASASPSPAAPGPGGAAATGTPAPAPSASATVTHGKAHVSHSPAAHGAG